jgi:hypothetical protein
VFLHNVSIFICKLLRFKLWLKRLIKVNYLFYLFLLCFRLFFCNLFFSFNLRVRYYLLRLLFKFFLYLLFDLFRFIGLNIAIFCSLRLFFIRTNKQQLGAIDDKIWHMLLFRLLYLAKVMFEKLLEFHI